VDEWAESVMARLTQMDAGTQAMRYAAPPPRGAFPPDCAQGWFPRIGEGGYARLRNIRLAPKVPDVNGSHTTLRLTLDALRIVVAQTVRAGPRRGRIRASTRSSGSATLRRGSPRAYRPKGL